MRSQAVRADIVIFPVGLNDLRETRFRGEAEAARTAGVEARRPAGDDALNGFVAFAADEPHG